MASPASTAPSSAVSVRETSRSLIEVGLEVGYTSPSYFAQVFRRVVGVTPTEFRSSI
jgi:AraC family transcriptional regulator